MTRRKKSKSAASGKGAAAVHTPTQDAPASASVQAGAAGPDVKYAVPTCPRTGYCLLGPRPVYPMLAPRPVQSLPAPRPTHILHGTRPMFASHGPRPVHLVAVTSCVTAAQPGTAPRPGTAAQLGTAPQPWTALRPETAHRVGTTPQLVSATHPVTATTRSQVPLQKRTSQVDQKTSSENLLVKSSVGTPPGTASCDRSTTSSTGSPTRSEEVSSVIAVASTNTSVFKDKKKPKQPYKFKVTYETKEINIYPRHPILAVERLRNLEYHVGELTEALGRRPAVYPLGRRVRFVPETAAEGDTIKRYLARIEAQEKISWCSYSLPPGNSLKVTVKVKVVERIKITDDLAKVKLQDEQSRNSAQAKQKDFDAKDVSATTSVQNGKIDKESSPKERHTSSSVKSVNKDNIKKQKNSATVNQMTRSNSGEVANNKPVLNASVHSTKIHGNNNKKNQSAIIPGRKGKIQEPKKTTETEKTAAAVKTVHERDNKLIIVGVQRTNKFLF